MRICEALRYLFLRKANPVSMKTNLRRIAALLLCLSTLFSLLVLSACNKDGDGDGNTPKPDDGTLTDAQKASIIAIGEAFAESGKSYSNDYGLTVKEIEHFIYYLYNGELQPEADGYASISGKEAAERIKSYFGIASILHTQKNSTEQELYYSGEKYYVKTNSPYAASVEIVSVKQNEDGNYNVLVNVICQNDTRVELDFVFKFDGDSTLVISCLRYDER